MHVNPERRKSGRFQKSLKAICKVEGRRYDAHTLDISDHGMSITVAETIPRASHYQVECFLPDDTSALLEVEEIQRTPLAGDQPALRLCLNFTGESMSNLAFFQRLAMLVRDDPDVEPPDAETNGFQAPRSRPGAPRRAHL